LILIQGPYFYLHKKRNEVINKVGLIKKTIIIIINEMKNKKKNEMKYKKKNKITP
jgi:hypothetical protein